MFLLIDPSETDKIHLALFDEKKIIHKIFSGRTREILACVDKLLEAISHKPEAIRGIMVVVGVGSFTSTRLACVIANTFAYVLKIPVMAIKKEDVSRVQELIIKLRACPAQSRWTSGRRRGNYISATYSGKPNITKSRSRF